MYTAEPATAPVVDEAFPAVVTETAVKESATVGAKKVNPAFVQIPPVAKMLVKVVDAIGRPALSNGVT